MQQESALRPGVRDRAFSFYSPMPSDRFKQSFNAYSLAGI
jgi:hypothetical protein